MSKMRTMKTSTTVFTAIAVTLSLTFAAVGASSFHHNANPYGHRHGHRPPTTTTISPTTTTVPIVTTTTAPVTTTTGLGLRRCFGTAMTSGQADINANGPNTTFCVSGSHTGWSLTPKTGDQFISNQTNPAIINGTNTTQFAFQGSATGVILDGLEVENYTAANQQGAIAATGTGWILRNLKVHDNGTAAGGSGSTSGRGWYIVGGRYYNNRQEGLSGGVAGGGDAQNSTVDGVELDHNNFTNDSYTTANHNCDDEAGGFKWVGSGNIIKNSSVHDNACRGLWADIDATNSTITNNHVYNNWADGIMIEISRGATITGNTVTGNGFKEQVGGAGPCFSSYGAGIFISTSGQTALGTGTITVTGNTVGDNCQSITAIDQERGTGRHLANLTVTGNTVTGSSNPSALNWLGAVAQRDTLADDNINFSSNSYSGVTFCNLSC